MTTSNQTHAPANPQPETGTVLSAEDYETLEYQSRLHAEKRPCGARPCDEEFPGLPQRWCSGCLVKALRAQLAAAQAALDEWAPREDGDTTPLADRIRQEGHDFGILVDHLSKTYDHFTRGKVSKPMTLPSVVIALAEDIESKDIDEAVEEATAELKSHLIESEATVARLREELNDWQLVADGVKHHFGCPNNATTGTQTLDEPCLRCQVASVREAARREAFDAVHHAFYDRYRAPMQWDYIEAVINETRVRLAQRDAPPGAPER